MKLQEFIDQVMDEVIVIASGDLEDDAAVTFAKDPEDLTNEDLAAEAMARDIEDVKDMSWDDVVAAVAKIRESTEAEDE